VRKAITRVTGGLTISFLTTTGRDQPRSETVST
jgi:hypothetical protein